MRFYARVANVTNGESVSPPFFGVIADGQVGRPSARRVSSGDRLLHPCGSSGTQPRDQPHRDRQWSDHDALDDDGGVRLCREHTCRMLAVLPVARAFVKVGEWTT